MACLSAFAARKPISSCLLFLERRSTRFSGFSGTVGRGVTLEVFYISSVFKPPKTGASYMETIAHYFYKILVNLIEAVVDIIFYILRKF